MTNEVHIARWRLRGRRPFTMGEREGATAFTTRGDAERSIRLVIQYLLAEGSDGPVWKFQPFKAAVRATRKRLPDFSARVESLPLHVMTSQGLLGYQSSGLHSTALAIAQNSRRTEVRRIMTEAREAGIHEELMDDLSLFGTGLSFFDPQSRS